jgi:GNAT superfamily N-acetyltransferase
VGVQFTVREATEGDIPGIEAAYLRSWRAAYKGYLDPDVLDDEVEKRRSFEWCRGIRAPGSAVFVAVEDERAVLGVVQADEVRATPRDLPEITMLYVDPRAWGAGVATILLHAAVTWVAERNHAAARLRVVEDHARARRFYEREGWHVDPDLEPAHHDLSRLIYYRRSLT